MSKKLPWKLRLVKPNHGCVSAIEGFAAAFSAMERNSDHGKFEFVIVARSRELCEEVATRLGYEGADKTRMPPVFLLDANQVKLDEDL